MWASRLEVQRVQKKALDLMKNMANFDHMDSGKRTKRDNEQQPKEQYKNLRYTTVSTVVQHTARGSAQNLGKHAVHVGSKTTSKQCEQHSSSPDTCMRCTVEEVNVSI